MSRRFQLCSSRTSYRKWYLTPSEAASPRSGVEIVALRGPSSVLISVEKGLFSRWRMNNEVKGLQVLVN